MKVIEKITVPTGNIVVAQGEKGRLEFLSLADYGKDVNVKFDKIGLTRRPEPVRHTKLLPLSEKWVITVSTQYGCSMGCSFCDVPNVGPGVNISGSDLCEQVYTAIHMENVEETKRLNVHFARMGEPSYNYDVIRCAKWLKTEIEPEIGRVHPVVSTMMPRKNNLLDKFIYDWMLVKNEIYGGNAGLQLSINSTNPLERHKMFNGNACSLETIKGVMFDVDKPKGRKITLNFAVGGYEINPDILLKYFNPEHYLIKLTPMHKTRAAIENGIKTDGDYTTYHPYEKHEEDLKSAGYDVLVFIASKEEDLGRVTCGNAILSGSKVDV